jgi:hypothetical protein
MKRREFLKSTMLLAAVSTVVGKAAGLFNTALAQAVEAKENTLGYKAKSPANHAKNNKFCNTCKHYKADAAAKDKGECTLPAMRTAMKSQKVLVANEGYCNMWAKKA